MNDTKMLNDTKKLSDTKYHERCGRFFFAKIQKLDMSSTILASYIRSIHAFKKKSSLFDGFQFLSNDSGYRFSIRFKAGDRVGHCIT